MKSIVSIFLLLLYIVSWVKPYNPYIDYAFNYDYIVDVLCENKAKPELKCNGICHLNKQLQKVVLEEQNSEKPLAPLTTETKEVLYTFEFDIWKKKTNNTLINKFNPFELAFFSIIYFDTVTPPPQILS